MGYSSKEITILFNMINFELTKEGDRFVIGYIVDTLEDGTIPKVNVVLDQKYKDVLEIPE